MRRHTLEHIWVHRQRSLRRRIRLINAIGGGIEWLERRNIVGGLGNHNYLNGIFYEKDTKADRRWWHKAYRNALRRHMRTDPLNTDAEPQFKKTCGWLTW